VWDGRLYAVGCNDVTGLEIWEHDGSIWSQVNTDGFGDMNNISGPSMSVFQDNLYIGTGNQFTACEIWKYDGSIWSQVNTDGFGDVNNKAALSMAVLGNHLYVGTANSAGCEIWKYDGSIWSQVNTDGFGDMNNKAAPSMAVLGNHLYVGTANSAGCEVWEMTSLQPQCPLIDPPSVRQVGFCDQGCQAEVPMTVDGGGMDVNFNYTEPVEFIGGVMSEDFSSVWWLADSCTLSTDFDQAATDSELYSCNDIAMPVGSEHGWVFWLVAPTATADFGNNEWWNTGAYELMFYQLP